MSVPAVSGFCRVAASSALQATRPRSEQCPSSGVPAPSLVGLCRAMVLGAPRGRSLHTIASAETSQRKLTEQLCGAGMAEACAAPCALHCVTGAWAAASSVPAPGAYRRQCEGTARAPALGVIRHTRGHSGPSARWGHCKEEGSEGAAAPTALAAVVECSQEPPCGQEAEVWGARRRGLRAARPAAASVLG